MGVPLKQTRPVLQPTRTSMLTAHTSLRVSPVQKTSNNVRLGLINNPVESPSSSTARIARAMWAAIQTQTANNAKNFITKLAKEETAQALEEGADVAEFAVGVNTLLSPCFYRF